MNAARLSHLAILVLVSAVSLGVGLLAVHADPASKSPAAGGGPVVVELFTSQGCSSCPPADRLLTELGKDPRLAGRVIPLAFHVDYWNYIGWTDPFSSRRWSERQQAYGRAFHASRIYTPQLVVGGRTECVGSQEPLVRKRIADALAAEAAGPAGRLSLDVAPEAGRLRVRVGAKLARQAAAGNLDAWVAIVETGLSTPVGAGENASRTLRNDHVVRRLEKAFTVSGAAGAAGSGELVLGLDKRWKAPDLRVVAFLQDPATLAIHGAAARDL